MAVESDIQANNSPRYRAGYVDRLIAGHAEQQHGVVSRAQLLRAGVAEHLIRHKLRAGRLHVLHLGVYAVGHRAVGSDARRIAAVFAAGPHAVLSHRAAAALWALIPSDRLEVTAPRERRRPGISIHRSRLPSDETTIVRGIPVTGVSRTLLDLATVLPEHRLERIANEIEIRGFGDLVSLPDLIARYPRRRGIRAIKAIVDRLHTGASFTRSELEALFIAFVRERGLPTPRMNAGLLGFECDCVWPQHGLVVELDGHGFHGTRAAFERDRARDRALVAAGWQVVRVTWRQLQSEPDALTLDLRKILSGAPRGRARGAGP